MKRGRWWSLWKKFEHWLVIFIIFMTCGGWFLVQWAMIGEPPRGMSDDVPACTDSYGRC